MFERFTADARRVVIDAQQEARALGHRQVGTEHLLLALAAGESDDAAKATLHELGVTSETTTAALRRLVGGAELDAAALESIGIDLVTVQQRVEDRFGPDALAEPAAESRDRRTRRLGHLPFTVDAKRSLEGALRSAVDRGERRLTTAHLLLGLLRAGGLGVRLLGLLGTTPAAVRADLDRRLRESA